MKQIRETSDFVCEKLIEQLELDITHKSILEPSCGDGKIIDYILNKYSNSYGGKFTCIELNKDRLDNAKTILEKHDERHKFTFIQADFLKWSSSTYAGEGYDRIIACPPFKGNTDVDHIQAMYDILGHHGVMVSLTSPYWITNNEDHQVMFREWLTDKDYKFNLLPDNSFMEKGKSVPTGILKITKHG